MITMQKNLKTLEEGKEEFLTDCKIRNLSEISIKSYNECFNYFINYMKENYKNINVREDLTKKTIDNYILYMKSSGLQETTINIRIRSIRCVLYYFMKNNYIEKFEIRQIIIVNTKMYNLGKIFLYKIVHFYLVFFIQFYFAPLKIIGSYLLNPLFYKNFQ